MSDTIEAQRVRLEIVGMHCAACAANVERALRGVPGVIEANVNFADESAAVSFDPAVASEDDLLKAVEGAGYQARTSGGRTTLRLNVTGMHCASCVRRVEEGLAELRGVRSATVNLADESASVEFDPSQVHAAELIQAANEQVVLGESVAAAGGL